MKDNPSKISKNISNINNDNDKELMELDIYLDKYKKNLKEEKRKINKLNKELINTNSENERILDKRKSMLTKTKGQSNNNYLNNNNENITNEESDSKYLIFMEKYYYHDIFKEYEDVKNSIFCISGDIFNYLNSNKSQKGVKHFMNKIIQNTKIFFNMSSIEKSILVDYYKEDQNNSVCVMGQCESDIDSIISSDVGINIKNPRNINTILCHYYSKKKDIRCIKDIIMNGKVFFENNILLELISFLCYLALNGYVLCSLMRNVVINEGELNFLEIEFFILTSLSFLGKNKGNIYLNQNSWVLNFYYNLQLGENVFIKLLLITFFCSIFSDDHQIEQHYRDKEFLSYYFVLSIEFMLCGILGLNFISFFKGSIFNNYYLIVFIIIYLIYLALLIFLNSSNYSLDILSITNFEHTENFVYSFTDNNRIYLLISLILDFCGTLIINYITFLILKKFIN